MAKAIGMPMRTRHGARIHSLARTMTRIANAFEIMSIVSREIASSTGATYRSQDAAAAVTVSAVEKAREAS